MTVELKRVAEICSSIANLGNGEVDMSFFSVSLHVQSASTTIAVDADARANTLRVFVRKETEARTFFDEEAYALLEFSFANFIVK